MSKKDWNKWCEENKDKIYQESDYLVVKKDNFINNKNINNNKTFIYIITMLFISFLTAGVFYYVSVNGYLSSNLLCGNNTILNRCEAITCGSYNITLPNIEIPSCPDCNEVNVYCNNS